MRNSRRITVMAVSAVIAVCSSTPAYAASPNTAVPVDTQGRITHVGGVNVVPTPAGLGLDLSASTEVLLAECAIGDGCASRAWQVDTPGQSRRWFLANVAYEPTTRLAHRFLLARAHTYQVMSAFSGAVNHTKGRHTETVAISGTYYSSPFRRVMMRDGRKMVLVQILMLGGDPLPSEASVAEMKTKARKALRKSWARVPTAVLPVGTVQ